MKLTRAMLEADLLMTINLLPEEVHRFQGVLALMDEVAASRAPQLDSEHRYVGLCPHCVANSRLVAARAATDALVDIDTRAGGGKGKADE